MHCPPYVEHLAIVGVPVDSPYPFPPPVMIPFPPIMYPPAAKDPYATPVLVEAPGVSPVPPFPPSPSGGPPVARAPGAGAGGVGTAMATGVDVRLPLTMPCVVMAIVQAFGESASV